MFINFRINFYFETWRRDTKYVNILRHLITFLSEYKISIKMYQ